MSLPVALPPGTVIGSHYIIGDLINNGGFGAVYRGIDTSEGNRPCAIKETYDVTPAARRQALMEASVLFTVRSSHLPEVYDALEANGRFYLIMQLVEGRNLLQLLKSRLPDGRVGVAEPYRQPTGPCSEQEVLGWLLPIMDILQELHSRNPPIIHRDIKPGNIILTPQGITVLVDFGLTKLYDPVHTTQTMIKAVSEGFSPLEQYVGKTSPQSDIYSMAATMYLLLTNRLPPEAVARTVRDDLIAPRLLNPQLTPKTERALLKALALNGQDRYQSMRAFAAALREPAFTGYSDPTLSVPPVQFQPSSQPSASALTIAASPAPGSSAPYPYTGAPSTKPAMPTVSGQDYRSGPGSGVRPGIPPQVPPLYPYTTPVPVSAVPGSPSQPAQPGQKQPGKQRVAPTEPLVRERDLPSPASQGCLWGIVQGLACGLLVLWAEPASNVLGAVLVGFLFYLLAGFLTTHRGGSVFRGARAGYRTGVIGTLAFWLTLGGGLLVLVLRRAQDLTATHQGLNQQPNVAIQQAWASLNPAWPNMTLLPQQPLIVNLLVWFGGGILAAWSLGLIGGMIGSSHHRAKTAQRKQQQQPEAPAQVMSR